ncbi:MAG: D-2-hydroxyacid dehydrogenase [Chloroflexi bacterium]|nr:D-2-hydroxyacid dehydrogenase [Chloroflexota bacterium]
MKIVVLDGHTLNPGDLSWEGLHELGEVDIYERTPPATVVERAQGAQAIVVNKVPITRETIDQLLPDLRYIGVSATGYDIVDIVAARERDILVTNVPTYGTDSVAQMVFAHLLNLTQHVAYHAETTRQGRWSESPDWCYWDYPLIELVGLTMGIVGFGRIGQAVGRLALAFGMQVIAYDAYITESPVPGVEMVASMERILRESDVISLHVPLTPETKGMINTENLAKMKRSAFLINTSRGAVVNEADLAQALNTGVIAGAGLDVLPVEPPPRDSPLLQAKNCYVTPHISWATRSARMRLLNAVVENLRAFIEGEPVNVVSR